MLTIMAQELTERLTTIIEEVFVLSNSKLVNYTKISKNSNPRKSKIQKITIHHMAGNLSVEACGNVFQTRKASSNYGIDSQGKVGMYVEEHNRAWTSSSPDNDHQAVTIEVANDQIGGAWHVSDKALSKLIDLCVDICKRNGIKQLNFTGNKNGNLTMHKWFAATTCPGPYLESKFPYIAEEVNKKLTSLETPQKQPKNNEYRVGQVITFQGGKHYSSANSDKGFIVKGGRAKITALYPTGKHPIHLRAVTDRGNFTSGVYGWVDPNTIE